MHRMLLLFKAKEKTILLKRKSLTFDSVLRKLIFFSKNTIFVQFSSHYTTIALALIRYTKMDIQKIKEYVHRKKGSHSHGCFESLV